LVAGRRRPSPPARPSSRTTALASSRLVCAALLAALLAGCTDLPAPSDDSGEGGFGLPQQLAGETYPGTRRELTGELRVAGDRCAYVELDGVERLAVWPAGSELSRPVRLPDATELEHGDLLRVTGAIVRTALLPGGADGYWGNLTSFCAGDVAEGVVIDAVIERR
jgi:hypothetical protein